MSVYRVGAIVGEAVKKRSLSDGKRSALQYFAHVRQALKSQDVFVRGHNKTLATGTESLKLTFYRGGKKIGDAIRQFLDDGKRMDLGWIGTVGSTGLLRPLHNAELAFAQGSKRVQEISSRVTSAITRRVFLDVFPGAQAIKGGKTVTWKKPN
jgi:hypothetical protein